MPGDQTDPKALRSRQEEGLKQAIDELLGVVENGCMLPKRFSNSKLSPSKKKAYRERLDQDSIVCLPKFVNKETVQYLRSQIKSYYR